MHAAYGGLCLQRLFVCFLPFLSSTLLCINRMCAIPLVQMTGLLGLQQSLLLALLYAGGSFEPHCSLSLPAALQLQDRQWPPVRHTTQPKPCMYLRKQK